MQTRLISPAKCQISVTQTNCLNVRRSNFVMINFPYDFWCVIFFLEVSRRSAMGQMVWTNWLGEFGICWSVTNLGRSFLLCGSGMLVLSHIAFNLPSLFSFPCQGVGTPLPASYGSAPAGGAPDAVRHRDGMPRRPADRAEPEGAPHRSARGPGPWCVAWPISLPGCTGFT